MKLSKYINLFDSFSGLDFHKLSDDTDSEVSSKVGDDQKLQADQLRSKLKVLMLLLSHSFVYLAHHTDEFSKENC